MNHSTIGDGVPDWIYTGLNFWLGVGSRPGVVREGGARIDVRAATWTPAGGVKEVMPEEANEYRYDQINPARKFPKPYDSLFSAWDVSSDGTVVGTGSWGDLRGIGTATALEDVVSYEPLTFQHGMRWKNGNWDTLGSLRRESLTEGGSIATAINPLGTVVVGGSAAPDRAGDPPFPTHAMRSVMAFGASGQSPGDLFLQDLTPLGDGSYAWAWDTDANGAAVGYSTNHQSDSISQSQAVWWGPSSTTAIELASLGHTTQMPEGYGYANAINAVGDRIVGQSLTSEGFSAGTVWALNANNGGNARWWEAGDLNKGVPSDWYVVNAVDINKTGFIVGIAYHTVPDPTNPNGPPIQQRRSVLLVPIELVDKDKKAVTTLKIGKMTETGALSGTEASAALDLDKDSDRFYVRMPGAAGLGAVSIKVATVETPDASYNDDETEIELQVEGNDLTSKSMLLVSDDVDDDYQVDGIADDANNDRTHKIQLGGKFQIKSVKIAGTEYQAETKTPVPVHKTVHFGVIILRDTVGGTPVVAQSDVESDLKIAQERYAQLGIALTWSIGIYDPPAGVDLSDGLLVATGDVATRKKVAPEARTLIAALGTANTNADIHVFYVNVVKAFGSIPRGVAIADYWFDSSEDDYLYNCFASADRGPFTVPHELAHLLADEAHHPSSINLLRNGTSTSNTLGGSKRLETIQEAKIRANPRAH